MLSKLERKYGKYAINNLTLILIGCYVVGYILQMIAPTALYLLCFSPAYILKGQVWRLITWIVMPPSSIDIFTLLMLFIFYQFGNILERSWGAFRLNLFVLMGIVLTVIGGFIAYAINPTLSVTTAAFSTYYISLSFFLLVAATFPNMTVMLYFIIPVKMKWAAAIHIAYNIYACITAYQSGNLGVFVMVAASLVNCGLMLYLVKNAYSSPAGAFKQAKRRAEYRKRNEGYAANSGYRNSSGGVTKHKCAICGKTENDGENLVFRFCTKCNGNYEYCSEHIYTHEHVK